MLPTKPVRLALGNLLAADTATLAPATANKIALVSAAFTPNENLTATDLVYATFVGSTPKAGASGPQGVGQKPSTGEQYITILTPVGGWRWVCTTAPGSPETIYGYAMLDTTLATLLAMAIFDTPYIIRNVNDEIDLGSVPMTFVLQPLS
jgi:hypothetical protein